LKICGIKKIKIFYKCFENFLENLNIIMHFQFNNLILFLFLAYKQMIECLVCHVDKRFTVDMMLDLEIFSRININTLQDQVPPYIPSLSSDNDVSNFPIHERVCPALNINDLKV
jgi:hypothetical protein